MALMIGMSLCSTLAFAGDLDKGLRRAESGTDKVRLSVTPNQREQAVGRVERSIRDVEVRGKPFLGLNDDRAVQRISRIERELGSAPLAAQPRTTGSYFGSRKRTKLIPFGPREVTLDPGILDE
ncbi:hypothetical protein KHP62_10870 [Rhodobacteraceae bacterium NNCM2]|nr:hypothetical protein [Coraliihabitans acroporae]